MKQLFYFAIMAVSVGLFSGCGSEDSGTCRFDVQMMIDKGNFDGAIDRLENDAACQSAYNGNEYLVNLGVAYMGKAGLGISDVISTMSTASDETTDTFGSFIDMVGRKTGSRTLFDLQSATEQFASYLGSADCLAAGLSYAEKDACLYIGLADVLKAATTINYLTEDVQGWIENNNTDEIKASACALEYAVDGNCTNGGTIIVIDANLTFDNNRSYEAIEVTVNTNAFDYLVALPTPSSTVVTEGYCTSSFVGCPDRNATCNACPVSQSAQDDELMVTELLVDALNSGFDSVSALISGDPDLQADIDEFKAEVADLNDGNTTISIDDIINYLNN